MCAERSWEYGQENVSRGGGRDESLREGTVSLEKGRIGGRAKEWYQISQAPVSTEFSSRSRRGLANTRA